VLRLEAAAELLVRALVPLQNRLALRALGDALAAPRWAALARVEGSVRELAAALTAELAKQPAAQRPASPVPGATRHARPLRRLRVCALAVWAAVHIRATARAGGRRLLGERVLTSGGHAVFLLPLPPRDEVDDEGDDVRESAPTLPPLVSASAVSRWRRAPPLTRSPHSSIRALRRALPSRWRGCCITISLAAALASRPPRRSHRSSQQTRLCASWRRRGGARLLVAARGGARRAKVRLRRCAQ
jgi:hypothetical protein